MVDFKKLVGSRPALRPVANLNEAQKIDFNMWTNYRPTKGGGVNGALKKIANAPVSTNWWDSFTADFKNYIGKPALNTAFTILDTSRNGILTQIDKWTDGVLDEYDVPGVGVADGIWGNFAGKKVYTDDILDKTGWENQEGWHWDKPTDMAHDVLGFAGDVLLDPITYITLGAGSAVKAAASGAIKNAADEALQVGLKAGLQPGTKQLEDFVASTLQKAATAKANNQLVGFNIPFGPEFSLLRKGDLGTDFLKVKSQKIGTKPAQDLANRMAKLGMTNEERYQFASKLFQRPISSFKELNTQEFDHLWKLLDNGMDRAVTKIKTQQVDDLLNNVDVPRQSLDALASKASKSYRHFEGADGISDIGKLLKSSRVAEGVGKLFGGKRYVPASVALQDHRIPQAVNIVEDARIGGYANARSKVDEMAELAKSDELKALSPEELELVPFVIEGKWPQSIDPASIAPDVMQRLQAAADKFMEYRDKFTRAELDAGVRYTPRDNYFPHILDIPKDKGEFDALIATLREADPDLALKLENSPRGFTRERKLFESMADVKDFLTRHADNPAIQEKFGNAVFNPIQAFARRAMSGAQETAKLQSYKQLEKLGVARKLEPGMQVPAGWEKVDLYGLENSIVPKEVKVRMENLNKIMTNDKLLNKTLTRAEEIYTIWRRNVTVVSPGFHIRQVIGNIFQNTLAGVTPKAYMDATKVLLGKGTVKIGRQELPPDRIIKMAMDDGVIGTGSSTDFLNSLTKELTTRTDTGNGVQKWLNPLSESYAPGQVGRQMSEAEDNWSRLAHYIYVLQKGGTRQLARESVIKHLFDYSNLSSFERGVMRTVIPFYAWMRNNIPFQIMQAVKRPGLYQVIDDLQEALQQEPDVDTVLDDMGVNNPQYRQIVQGLVEDNGGVNPAYIQERYVRTNFLDSLFGDNSYFNLGLPSSDLSTLSKPPTETLVQSINPALSWMFGMGTNTNTFGAPINQYGDSVDVPSGVRYTLDQLGGLPGRAAGMALSNVFPSLVGQTSANQQDLLGQIGRLLGVTQVDPAKSLEGLIYERSRQIDNEKKRQKAMEGR